MKPNPFVRNILASAGSALLAISSASAQATLFWDATPDTPDGISQGGAGTWDTTAANWDDGTIYSTWNNGNGDTAVFGGTAGAINLGADVIVGGLTFSTGGYSVAPGTGPFGITFGAPGNINVSTGTATLTAAIGGANKITKTGGGTLILNGGNTFSGGIDIAAGRIQVFDSANESTMLGDAGNTLTFTGNAELYNSNNVVTMPQGITVNEGVTATLSGAFQERTEMSGVLAGSGTVVIQGNSAGWSFEARNTANTFTGPIRILSGDGASFRVRSLADSEGAGNISLQSNGNLGGHFEYMSGATTGLTLDNRQIELIVNGNSGTNFGRQARLSNNAATANTVTVNTDLLITGTGNKTFILAGSNTGDNSFNGLLADKVVAGDPVVTYKLSPYKDEGGKWILGNNSNSYTGATTIAAGTLSASSIANADGTPSALGAPTTEGEGRILIGNANSTGTLLYTGAAASTDRTIQVNSSNSTNTGGATITNNGSGALTFTAPVFNAQYTNTSTTARTLTLNGTNGGEIEGTLQNNSATAPLAVTAAGSGVWELSGANTYSGNTTVNNGGTLLLSGSNDSAGITVIGTGGGTLRLNSASNGGLGTGALNLNANPGVVQAVNADRAITNNLIVQSNPTFSGDFSLTAGNLRVNNADRTVTNNIIAGKSLTVASIDRDGSNNRNLTLEGTGTTRVLGDIALGTGVVSINGGTFTVNGTATTGDVNVNNASILGGSGTISSAVNLAADAGMAPGDGVGTLTVGTKLNLFAFGTGTGKLEFELGTVAASDRLAVTGELDIGGLDETSGTLGLSDFTFTNVGGLQAGTYTLMTSGSLVGFLDTDDLTGTIGGFSAALQLNGNNVELVLTGEGGASPYETWAGTGVAFDADANGDGVPNGVAFLLGAAGPNVNALDLLPTVSQSGGGLVLNFSMLNATARGEANLQIEHSADLGISDAWTAVIVPNSSGGPTSGVTFAITPGNPLNTVTATIATSEAVNGKLFSRFKAVNP